MSGFFRYSAETTKSLAESMDKRGFACLPDCLSESDLEPLRSRVSGAGLDPTGKYAVLQDRKTFDETALTKIPASPEFQLLCQQLLKLATRTALNETDHYQVVRCLNGDVGRRNSYFFHYDTYVLTVLIPIMIPQTGERGDLVLFPNVRKSDAPTCIIFLTNSLSTISSRNGFLNRPPSAGYSVRQRL